MQTRSTSFGPFFAALCAAATLALGQGCSESTLASESPEGSFENPNASRGQESDDSSLSKAEDAGGAAAPYRGSPLCAVTEQTCMPDESSAAATEPGEQACASSTDASLSACRLTSYGGSLPTPSCGKASAEGTDGAQCKRGEDCAPGFDCIEQAGGSICRRYCCAGTCQGHSSRNGGPTFCDVQKLVDINPHKAPVCMPIKHCALLTAGQCAEYETCSVVTEKGDTACVANGSAQAGQSCEEEHCGVGLTCLGAVGNRTCYQLCKTDGSVPCAPSQECRTNMLFQNSAFGVCKDVVASAQ